MQKGLILEDFFRYNGYVLLVIDVEVTWAIKLEVIKFKCLKSSQKSVFLIVIYKEMIEKSEAKYENEMMVIKQKKNSNKHTFRLEDDYFNFAYEGKSGSGDFDMNYADFIPKSAIQIEQNEGLRNVGFLWCLIGLFQLGVVVQFAEAELKDGFWLVSGLIFLVWTYFSKVTYSVFKAEQGNVFVIHDRNHDEIVKELVERRKSQLLNWYGDVNLENDLEQEIEKFKWLVKQGVITNSDSERRIAQAELLHKQKLDGRQPLQ